jgi:hypothetical protein
VKYMLQVRFNGADAAIRQLPAGEQERITAEFIAIRNEPGVLDGNQLAAPSSARIVQVIDGQTIVSESLATPDGAGLDGYYIYDAPDIDAATAFASCIPVARMGGTIEVRALVER